MAIDSIRARDFWLQLDNHQKSGSDEPDCFKRGTSYRSSYNPGTAIPSTSAAAGASTLHGPVWGSIYCTMRDRSRGRAIRSASTTSQRGVIRAATPSKCRSASSTSINCAVDQRPTLLPGRTHKPAKMTENDVVLTTKRTEPGYIAPKRYETTCYFMPLAVPVWYSTSVSIKINSTKRTYNESVNYQQKLVPYRYVETMTTVTPKTPEPVAFVADLNITREIPAEHYISLEPQQEAALNKPFSASHEMKINTEMLGMVQ